jgi:acyl dehydratase
MSRSLHHAELGSTIAEAAYGPFGRDDLRRYSEASGDLNPLHLDPAFARKAGFDDVIVHGMLGMALLGRLVTEAYPTHRLLRLRVRFRNSISAGEEISCVAKLERLEAAGAVLSISANNARGTVLIDGCATIATTSG